MQRLRHELWRGSLPIIAWLVINVWEVEAAVAIVGHYVWSILRVKISLAEVPVIILAGLCVQLVLLLITELNCLGVHRWMVVLHLCLFHCFLST